jgi:hypothetical protein
VAYTFYIGGVMLPVSPSQVQLKIKNQNKTINLITEGEVNIIKMPGLTEVSFKALLPNAEYPFAQYLAGFRNAAYFLERFEKLKLKTDRNGKYIPFQFIISRAMPGGKVMFGTNMRVTLEDYKISEDAKEGFDIVVDVVLKQYRPYGTKTVTIVQPTAETVIGPGASTSAIEAHIENSRPDESAPQSSSHTVGSGDSLWSIAKIFLNDGNRFKEIYDLNQSAIDGRNKGSGLSKYTIYSGQVLALPI